ncbi:nuclear mRNA export, poly(A)+RNA binding protein [Microbotryomycetes sp. JL201]|nr:nuclear mRNA export, poly(A)+RNA binding protein [Microbotryomycetes sp. JL201]
MVGSAGATLFQAAVNKASSSASTSAPSHQQQQAGAAPMNTDKPARRGTTTTRGRNGRLSRTSLTGAAGNEDVGMADADGSGGANRRQRTAATRSGPMGHRPTRGGKGKAPLGKSQPRVIKNTDESQAETKGSTIDTLRLFLMSRYSAEAQMLNLENMAEDPILREANIIPPGQKGAPSNMAGALWKMAATELPGVVTISFANNQLKSLLPLSPWLLTSSLPNVENVSFAKNLLSNWRDLDPFSPTVGKTRTDGKPKGWPKLKELVMTGNPMVKTEGDEAHEYQVQMARRFANLTQLDQKPIDPAIAFQAKTSGSSVSSLTPGLSPSVKKEKSKPRSKREPIVFPLSIAPGFFESEPTRDFVAGFLSQFFPAYDNDRQSLLAAYAPVCTFSFSLDTNLPARSKAKKIGFNGDKKFPNQRNLDSKPYLGPEGSRNLERVKYPAKRASTLKTDPAKVIASIVSLPSTQHPLDDPSKFVFDTWTMPGVLAPSEPGGAAETVIFAVVHGEFTELPSKGVRSFDRTFILAPAPPGSAAQTAGWPCLILSDLLVIRGYSDPKAWQPTPPPGANGGPGQQGAPVAQSATAAPGQQERAEGISDEQHSLVLQLQQVTNLTYTFAHMALAQNNWDPQLTMTNFQTLMASGTIPAEAFRHA